uniref:Putative cuticular protein n=1 Tax=Rhodnius prolixus TaxID=13249 RepID=R4FM05_RHOPR
MYKFVVFAAVLAYANAGGLLGVPAVATTYAAAPVAYGHAVPAAVTSQSSNVYRSFGNLGQVSTYSKTVDTPFSSVRKSDVRVSNPGLATVAHAPVAYAAPAYASYAHAAPAYASYAHAAPAYASYAHAAPAYASYAHAAPVVAKAYAPAVAYSAAPVVAKTYAPAVAYSAAPVVAKAYAPAVAYSAAPVVAKAYAPAVSYSAAPAVSHLSYTNSYGLQYGW